MYEFHPYFTNDGSVGLYSPEFDDIYHSATGAMTEAVEKFILPAGIDDLIPNKSIKVLDICYGLGYNTKSFLNYIFEKFCKKNSSHVKQSTAPIYTNNIASQNDEISTDTIHGDNIFSKIYIKSVDNDKILSFLSPFIICDKKSFKNTKINFDYKKIEKYLLPNNKLKNQKFNKIINFLIFEKLAQNSPDFLSNEEISQILNDKTYKEFFDLEIRRLYKFYQNQGVNNTHGHANRLCLHNIYYQYISNRYKNELKRTKLEDVTFELENGDARTCIINDKNEYDLIFLDAFTPSKCPCLWSYEFFKLLFTHLKPNGKILTYSTSASIRAAMLEAGLNIGYIYNEREEKFTGTIATKNKSMIKYPLSEFDLGLLKTKAGIFYRDENLTGQNEAINARRKSEVQNSNKLSSSAYKKQFLE